MKASFIGASGEEHAGNGVVTAIGQNLKLLGGSDVEQLAVVVQDSGEELPREGLRLKRRVETAGLAVTGTGAGNYGKGPSGLGGDGIAGVGEFEGSFGRESMGIKRGKMWRWENGDGGGDIVVGETIIVHQNSNSVVGKNVESEVCA